MLRDARMRIKAVNDIEILHVFRRLLRQIRRTAAAENHDVDLVLPGCNILDADNRYILRPDLDRCRIAARKDRHKLHILMLPHGALHAAAQIAISQNTNANTHEKALLCRFIITITLCYTKSL